MIGKLINLFKKKKDKKLTWDDVTTKQFFQLQAISKEMMEDAEEEKNENETIAALFTEEKELDYKIKIAELFFGEDVHNLSKSEFDKKYNLLTFLNEPKMKTHAPKKEIKINGRTYTVTCLAGKIPVIQVVDFLNFLNENDIPKAVAALVVPKGHTYNDGYNMIQVFDDINDMPCTFVNDVANFFAEQWMVYLNVSRRYSLEALKKTNLPKKEREALMKVTKIIMDLVPTDFSRMS